jgi:hypothetical protein
MSKEREAQRSSNTSEQENADLNTPQTSEAELPNEANETPPEDIARNV